MKTALRLLVLLGPAALTFTTIVVLSSRSRKRREYRRMINEIYSYINPLHAQNPVLGITLALQCMSSYPQFFDAKVIAIFEIIRDSLSGGAYYVSSPVPLKVVDTSEDAKIEKEYKKIRARIEKEGKVFD